MIHRVLTIRLVVQDFATIHSMTIIENSKITGLVQRVSH